VLLDEPPGTVEISPAQAEILCELDVRFKPELRFSVRMLNVDVRPWLFSREEVEAKPTLSKDRWAHGGSVPYRRTATKLPIDLGY